MGLGNERFAGVILYLRPMSEKQPGRITQMRRNVIHQVEIMILSLPNKRDSLILSIDKASF